LRLGGENTQTNDCSANTQATDKGFHRIDNKFSSLS
jgi:hypothetical protein